MDHISIPIADAERTKAFYTATLAPLGWTCSGWHPGRYVGFKKPGSPALYFAVSTKIGPAHLALKARNEDEVHDFFRIAIDSGGTDNGRPGPRPDYGAGYFAAFVLDPDGHNVEAVIGGVG